MSTDFEKPQSKQIEYVGLESLFSFYFFHNMPDQVRLVPGQKRVLGIDNTDISSIRIEEDGTIKLEGTSCIHIGYFGSPNPRDEDYGTFDESTRSFSFRISITDGEIDKGAYFEFE